MAFKAATLATHAAIFVPLLTRSMDASLSAEEQMKQALVAMTSLGVGALFGALLNGVLRGGH